MANTQHGFGDEAPPPARTGFGRASMALAAVLAAVFVLEVAAGRGTAMQVSPALLARMGGNTPINTLGIGEYWRLVTAVYLHGGLVHAGMNIYALLTIGSAIEVVLGASWMYFAFVASGVTGSLLSAYAHKPNVVAIGASGGIFGLIAMAAVLAWLMPRETGLRKDALVQWLIFGLVIGVAGGFDNWGHLGGVGGGVALALVVVLLKSQRGALKAIGWAGAAAALLASVASAVLAAQSYREAGEFLGL